MASWPSSATSFSSTEGTSVRPITSSSQLWKVNVVNIVVVVVFVVVVAAVVVVENNGQRKTHKI